MNRTDQSKNRTPVQKSVLSVKVVSIILAGLLLLGTVPATHSYPSAKADLNNIWLAVHEFWDSLQLFKSQQQIEQEVAVFDPIDSTEIDVVAGTTDESLQKLKNHPQCRSIYVSEYLPTFNSHVIEKCERAIKQHEQKQLFDTYVNLLCLNPSDSSLGRKQLGEIQLRLRKYALTFPQSNLEVSTTDVDGLYGVKTCEVIANYQIISDFDAITGVADMYLYDDLAKAIPLNETELAGLNWQPNVQYVAVAKTNPVETKVQQTKSSFKMPKNPFKRIAFCMRNKHIQQCNYNQRSYDLAKAEINQR